MVTPFPAHGSREMEGDLHCLTTGQMPCQVSCIHNQSNVFCILHMREPKHGEWTHLPRQMRFVYILIPYEHDPALSPTHTFC